MSTPIFTNRTLLTTYEYDQTCAPISGSWSGFTINTTQINGAKPPIAGAEIILYYIVSPTNLGTINTKNVNYVGDTDTPLYGGGYYGQIKFTLAGGASTTTNNSYTVNGGNTTTTQNGLISYQWTSPVAGSYLYVWLSHDYIAQSCTITVTATSAGGLGNWSGAGDTLSDGCVSLEASQTSCLLNVSSSLVVADNIGLGGNLTFTSIVTPEIVFGQSGNITFDIAETGNSFQILDGAENIYLTCQSGNAGLGNIYCDVSDGWLGINTATPQSLVEINQGANNSGSTSNDGKPRVIWNVDYNNNPSMELQCGSPSSGISPGFAAYIDFVTSDGADYDTRLIQYGTDFSITGNGAVVISANGTTLYLGTGNQIGVMNSSPGFTLDITGNARATAGYQLPNYTTISSPTEGLLAYNFSTRLPTTYNGTTWV